ncbi:MAG TPA: single-stranded DNA-binding protein [Micromonosporaceae bacterium]|nr:single-stranded DNA-binding protein [Micromonosporaceae bacterium]
MAANETILTITGNLTDDPDLRVTASGVSVCRFTVASTPRVFDKTTNTYRDGDPLFLTCTAWRDLAEHVAESLGKGTRVIVTGRLRLSRWQTPEGEKRSAYGLDVDEVGPSLRFATATVNKLTRSSSGPASWTAEDPWATATPATAGAAAVGGDTPPF